MEENDDEGNSSPLPPEIDDQLQDEEIGGEEKLNETMEESNEIETVQSLKEESKLEGEKEEDDREEEESESALANDRMLSEALLYVQENEDVDLDRITDQLFDHPESTFEVPPLSPSASLDYANEAPQSPAISSPSRHSDDDDRMESSINARGHVQEDQLLEDTVATPRKRRRIMMSSDEDHSDDDGRTPKRATVDSNDVDDTEKIGEEDQEEDDENAVDANAEVGALMANIFGDSDDDGDSDQDVKPSNSGAIAGEDEARMLGDEKDEMAQDVEWDFDVMMKKRRDENKRGRRRRRDGSIDLLVDADEQIKILIDTMRDAAKDDRHSNTERKPALQKRKMLPLVKTQLRKADLVEPMIDNGMMNVLSEWLAPLPDKSLPALEIRSELLKILQDYAPLEQGVLRQSGLGKAVMLLYKHPRETSENKKMAAKLISEWARPIFQLDTDYRSLSREERVQRDYAHQMKKMRRTSVDERKEGAADDDEPARRPGDKGWIGRARVPRPSTKDYVVRPKSTVEGQFRGASRGTGNRGSRFDRTLRDLKEKRSRKNKSQHAVEISIEGRKLP